MSDPRKPDIHVLPENDLREHIESRACWCHPNAHYDPLMEQPAVVVHNAADGRELVEQYGLN